MRAGTLCLPRTSGYCGWGIPGIDVSSPNHRSWDLQAVPAVVCTDLPGRRCICTDLPGFTDCHAMSCLFVLFIAISRLECMFQDKLPVVWSQESQKLRSTSADRRSDLKDRPSSVYQLQWWHFSHGFGDSKVNTLDMEFAPPKVPHAAQCPFGSIPHEAQITALGCASLILVANSGLGRFRVKPGQSWAHADFSWHLVNSCQYITKDMTCNHFFFCLVFRN